MYNQTGINDAFFERLMQHDKKSDEFFERIQLAIAKDELELPSLPEVAMKIRACIEKDNSSAQQIADIMIQDSAISAHFIRIANSALYRGQDQIKDLQTIISRLGLSLVKDLILSIAMRQVFNSKVPALQRQFREAWKDSVDVAALARVLVMLTPHLSQDQAMLCGLIHNIGLLPVLVMADRDESWKSTVTGDDTDAELEGMATALQPRVGKLIVENWEFPQHFVDVVSECYDFDREHEGPADYIDIVQVAILQRDVNRNLLSSEELFHTPACQKLHLNDNNTGFDLNDHEEIIIYIKNSLMG